jgi:hypothetical protein
MLKRKIRKILNEIKFSQERADELKDKYRWRYVQTYKPKSDSKYNSVRIYTFTTPKKNIKGETAGFKYIVKIEEYDYDFFLISFSTKLNKDFYVKQQRLSSSGEKYYDEYSYLTKEKIPLQILSLMVSEMKNILKDKSYSSFGYFGAPDYKMGSQTDLFNTKRVRIYNELLNGEFSNTHIVRSLERFSGGLILNKEVLEEYPEFETYCEDILKSHL